MFNPPRHGARLDWTSPDEIYPARACADFSGRHDRPFLLTIFPAVARGFREPIPALSRPNPETAVRRAGLAMRRA
jgi:hypothetical protein